MTRILDIIANIRLELADLEDLALKSMCKCGKNPKEPPHQCPFQADVNSDRDTLCECCDDCQHQCAMDI
jgi:hypothetical protein